MRTRKSQEVSTSTSGSTRKRRLRKSQQRADPVPRKVRFNVPGHPRHGVVVDLVSDDLHFRWRNWDLGRRLIVVLPPPESYRILLNPYEIQEL